MLYRLLSMAFSLRRFFSVGASKMTMPRKSSKEAMASDEIISRANPAIRDLNVGKIRS